MKKLIHEILTALYIRPAEQKGGEGCREET